MRFPTPMTLSWEGHRQVSGESFHLSRRQASGTFTFQAHGHLDFFELILVLRGTLHHQVHRDSLHGKTTGKAIGRTSHPADESGRHRSFSDRAGMLRLMRPGDIHALHGRDISYFNLAFPQTWMDRLAILWEEPDLPKRFMASPEPPSVALEKAAFRDLATDVEALLARRQGPRARRLFALVLSRALAALAGEERTRGSSQEASRPVWLRQILSHYETHLEEELRPGDLAARLGITHAHFTRSFQKHMGISPSAHLAALRLERAANLLAGTDDPVTAICLSVGFRDAGHFSRLFHRRYGESPRSWRERHMVNWQEADNPDAGARGAITHRARSAGSR